MPGLDIKEELRGDGDPASQTSLPGMPAGGDGPPSAMPSATLSGAQQPAPVSIQISVDEEMQKTLVEIVLDDFEKAKADRGKKDYGITSKGETLRFDEWFKALKDLYNGNRIPKTIPWKFCSNRSLRIGTAILDLIHARIFPAVWNEDLTRWRPGTAVDVPKAERISKFMDWWIRVHAPLRPFADLWTKYTAGIGDSLTETSWDVEEIVTSKTMQQPVVDEGGQPLINQDGTPAVNTVPQIERIEKTKSRIITKDNVYLMENARDILRDPVIIEETILFKELEDLEKQGACVNVTGEEGLEKFLLVPDPTGDMDDTQKEKIKKIKRRNMPVKVIREYLNYDIDGVGANESIRVYVSPEHRIYLGGIRMRDVTKSGRRPIKFTKYDNYLDRPEDLDGEGVLMKVKELAEEVDACFNQLTDANTLGVLRPFFYDPSGDLDAPAIELGPNKGIPVTDPARNVYFPPIEIPTERLINAIQLVMEFVERLTAASSYVMGRESEIVGGSGTATRTQAIVQSAEIRFTLPSERLRFGISGILTDHLDIIQLNIKPGMEEQVLGEKGEKLFLAGELTDEGIGGKFQAFLLPDPSMGSKQTERDLMSQLYSILIQNPIVMSTPQNIYWLTASMLKSQGKDDEFIQRILGVAPDMDAIDDPEAENTLMIQGEFGRVTPQITENHLLHIQKHMDLEKSPHLAQMAGTAPELTNQILEYNRLHIQQHMQMMVQMQAMMGQKKGGGGNSGGEQNPGESGKPGEGGNQKNPGEASGKPGMENVPGPMGAALNAQRGGQSGRPAPAK